MLPPKSAADWLICAAQLGLEVLQGLEALLFGARKKQLHNQATN